MEIPATEKRNSYSMVRKLSVQVGTKKINFVDFNSAVLVCMHPEGKTYYDNCNGVKYYQKEKWLYETALEYYTTLRKVIKTLESDAWNVMRAHHPPANSEDGDMDFYWARIKKKIIDGFIQTQKS